MGKIRAIVMYTGTEHIQAERVGALHEKKWYIWRANVTITEEELLQELPKMDRWEVLASD